MTAILDDLNAAPLSVELIDALQRFDRDARMICAAAATPATLATDSALYADALRAYRNALVNASGRPLDPSWVIFVRATATFVARTEDRCDPSVAAAVSRLRRLVDENADLLDDVPVHETITR